MLIELQTTTARFLTMFANKIRLQPFCLTDPVAKPLPFCPGPWFIDHVTVPEGSIVQLSPGTVQLQQPISLNIVLASALAASGPAETAPCLNPQPNFNFNLNATVDDTGIPLLNVSYAGSSLPLPDLEADVQDVLGNLTTPASTPLPLDAISSMFGTNLVAIKAGIAADPTGQRVAIRVEFAGGGAMADWGAFFAGQFKAHDPAHDWSVFVSADLIEQSIDSRMNKALEKPIADGTFTLDSGPDVSYLGIPVVPIFSAAFSGEAVDACQCLWGKIDLGVDISATIALSVPQADTLQMDLFVNWDLDDWEVACCAFTAAVFWGFVGTELLDEGKIDWGEFLAGIAGGATFTTVFNAVIGAAHGEAGKQVDFPGWQKIDEDDDGFHYRSSVTNSAALTPLGLTMTGLLALPDGVSFGGTQTSPMVIKEARLKLEYSQFEWVLDECGARTMVAMAWASFIDLGMAPIHACTVEILSDDPLNQFGPFLKWADDGLAFRITYASINPDYFANPYPCQVRVITNGGVRIISFKPIPYISKEDVQTAEKKALIEYPLKCKEYLESDQFWKPGGRFNPHWAPDPPWERLVQQWHAIVQGLAPGETLTVQSRGAPVAEISANSRGVLEFAASVAARRGEQGLLELQRERSARGVERNSVLIKQVPLRPLGTLPAGGRPIALSLLNRPSGPAVALATSEGLALHSLLLPGYSRLMALRLVTGLRGLIFFGGSVIGWGDQGIVALGNTIVPPFEAPISGAAADGRLLLLSQQELHVFERGGRSFIRRDQVQGERLALGHGVLAAADSNAVTLYDAHSFRLIGRIEIRNTAALKPAHFAGARAAFFVSDRDHGGSLVALSERGEISVAGRYFQAPLPFTATRLASRLAVIEAGRTVELYGAGASISFER
jgi:hypothetical protein